MVARADFLKSGQQCQDDIRIDQCVVIGMVDFLQHIAFRLDVPSMELSVQVSEGRMGVQHIRLCLLRQDVSAPELAAECRVNAVVPFPGILHIAV